MKATVQRRRAGAIAVFLVLAVTGCFQKNLGVGSNVANCCITDYDRYATFAISADALPGFLQPVLVDELTQALTRKGLSFSDTGSDLLVRLTLNQENLGEQAAPDPFQGRLDPGGEVRFLADLRIDMIDTVSKEVVWTGVLSRIHDVVPGAVMPLDKARIAIGAALEELLADYPARHQ